MGKSNSTLMAALVLFSFAAGLLVGTGIDRGKGELADSAGNSLVAPQARNSEQGPQHPFQIVRGADAPRPAESVEGFAYRRLTIDSESDAPSACFSFTSQLDNTGTVNYADFVRIASGTSTATRPAVRVDGSNLCLLGLSFAQDYEATLLEGLPDAQGVILQSPQSVKIAFGDRPAFVGFAGSGVILPRMDADGLAIETVNVSEVELEVFRVADRALVRKRVLAGEAVQEGQYAYVYGQDDGKDVGTSVVKTSLSVKREPNANVTTVFPFGAALSELKAGAYFVSLKDASPGRQGRRRTAEAWRWIVFTDLALTSYRSSEGMDVVVRSIKTARPLQSVSLQLIAENNEVLATRTTSSEGRASFPRPALAGEGPLRPKMIFAFGGMDDFAALDISRPPLDLSDFDTAGRRSIPVVDGYLYTDRGIYRPGETVHLTGLMRNRAAEAVDRAAQLIVKKPNGIVASRVRVLEPRLGSASSSFTLPASSPRGVWTAELNADGVGVVARQTFSVEDFVPQRMEVLLEANDSDPLVPGETRKVTATGRYFYGAPAADLRVEAEARLRLDPNPFPTFSEYRFGPVDGRFSERFLTFDPVRTDADGKADVQLVIDEAVAAEGAPLRADLVVGIVEDGGRVVRESARIPVRANPDYIGLKVANENGSIGVGDEAMIDIVALDRLGTALEGEVEWRLVEEDYWFDWYQQNGEWRWRRSFKDIPVSDGRLKTSPEGLAQLKQRLEPGSYRLTAFRPGQKARTDLRFYVGWRSYGAGADQPDKASLTLTSRDITPGARTKLYLDPPYAGEATIMVATDKVVEIRRMRVEEGGREITIDTNPEWGSGFYVLATIVTNRDALDRPVPRRAMGLAHVPFDIADRGLSVSLDLPERVRPRQVLDVPISISGLTRGEDAMVTLSAVDEGILRLTKFKSPDPAAFYYAKKQFPIEVHDDYGRILNANLAAPTDYGGDQIGGEGLTVVPTKTVALFQGPVMVDDDGTTTVRVTLPDFAGELRLMAVAWSERKLGAQSRPLTVRDSVATLVSLPRFLAPGDTALASLSVDNVEGPTDAFRAVGNGEGVLRAESDLLIELDQGETSRSDFAVSAEENGIGAVFVDVTGEQGFSVRSEYPLQVRSPFHPRTNISTSTLQPGQSITLDASLLSNLQPGSADVTVGFSPISGIETNTLLASLSRYPYGCSEQLVSVALPLLYANQLASVEGQGAGEVHREKVQEAINRLLDRQGTDGAFGLWRENDRAATAWLGVYVTDFLWRASELGYAVPAEALDRALLSLGQVADPRTWAYGIYRASFVPPRNDQRQEWQVRQEAKRRESAAYALYVLARSGRGSLADVRYFHDALLEEVTSPLARAHIGAALAILGDRARALSAFQLAADVIGEDDQYNYYQTPLRDIAGALALALEIQRLPNLGEFETGFDQLQKDPDRMHTQEKAHVLMAARAMLDRAGVMNLYAGEEPLTDGRQSYAESLSPRDLQQGTSFENRGDGPIYVSTSVYGSPTEAPVATANGFRLSKEVFTKGGEAVDLASIKQNDEFVIVLKGTPEDDRLHPAILVDLLPAGFEIDTVLRPKDGALQRGGGPFAWVGKIDRLKMSEARDDRFVAALDVREDSFTAAYLVRAVTPGTFTFPGASIEDMYRPSEMATTEVQQVQISR